MIFWPEAAVPDYIEDDPIARIRIARLLGQEDVLPLAFGAVLVASASATQDIVIDAFRVESIRRRYSPQRSAV